jgi:hypothetical protein
MPSISPQSVMRLVSTVLPLLALCAGASLVEAQVTELDPSVQSAGMGGATIAAFWLDQPNTFINPALMGFQRGITYSFGSTDISPPPFVFASEAKFQTHQILVGAHGIGLESTGKPIESLGRLRVDYGPTEITDINGNVIGEAHFLEDLRTLAIGVDVVALIASFQEASSGEPAPIRNRLSVAVGHAWKTWKVALEPAFDFDVEEEDAKDIGGLVRYAALDQIGSSLGEASQDTRCRVEIAGAYSRQDWDEEFMGINRYGASVRLTVAPPTDAEGWVADFGSPSIGFGLLWTAVDPGNARNQFGAEATLDDILYLRAGLVESYFIDDFFPGVPELKTKASFGGGVKLNYRKMLGARFDYANFPGLSYDLDRFQGSLFLDPIRLWKEVR